jgi:hypothetical protein
MCWSAGASIAMTAAGGAAMVVSAARCDPKAIWLTLGYFTVMEALQAAGYAVVDQCGSKANQGITLLSYLHIAGQPIAINAFAMAIAPRVVAPALRRTVYVLAALATATLLLRLVPLEAVGTCQPGDVLCGARLCLVSGKWHIGWEVPLNDLPRSLGVTAQFPAYLLAVFVLPLAYGSWRFVLFHALAGPILADVLTDNPLEMPAIWCLFSIGIILIALIPRIRYGVMGAARPTPA